MQLTQIEIDFDIHQMIELERRGFEEQPYVALRRLLKLPERGREAFSDRRPLTQNSTSTHEETGKPFVEDGVSIPHGSMARMKYQRGSQVYEGQYLDGKLVVNGVKYASLSPAASALGITKNGGTTSLNGWLYWEAKFPGKTTWQKLSDLRKKSPRR